MFLDVFEPFKSTTSLGVAHAALLMVFPARSEVETFLRFEFNKNLADISPPSDTRTKTVEIVLLDAEAKGYFNQLITKAKAKFPDNDRFQRECDKALALKRQEDGGEGVPIDVEARSLRLLRNAKRLVLYIGVGLLWSALVMGPTIPLAVVSGLGTLWGGLVALYKQLPWLGGRIDRCMVRVLSHSKTGPCLIGLLVLGLGFSLFVGSLEIDQGNVKSESVEVASASSEMKPRLISTKQRHYFLTTPWSGRKLNLHLDGYLPHPSTICPWRTTKVWLDELEPAPYVLLIPRQDLMIDIYQSMPWQVTVRVGSGATPHELLSYYGEPILIGQEDDPPECIRPKGTLHQKTLDRMIHAAASRKHPVPNCPDEPPGHVYYSTVEPSIQLKPGMELSIEWKEPSYEGLVYCDKLTVTRSDSVGDADVHILKDNKCR